MGKWEMFTRPQTGWGHLGCLGAFRAHDRDCLLLDTLEDPIKELLRKGGVVDGREVLGDGLEGGGTSSFAPSTVLWMACRLPSCARSVSQLIGPSSGGRRET